MQKRIKRLNIIGYGFLAFQGLVYLGNLNATSEPVKNSAELAGYYFGFNLWLIIAIVLFIRARNLRKKLKELELKNSIDSIGSNEI